MVDLVVERRSRSMIYLEFENVFKFYGEKIFFNEVSFFINKGNKVVLVVKNGIGKLILLCIAGGVDLLEGVNVRVYKYCDVCMYYLVQEFDFGES